MTVIELSDKRPPVCYTIRMTQHWNGKLEVFVEDIADDERSRKSAAEAMRQAADLIEKGDAK